MVQAMGQASIMHWLSLQNTRSRSGIAWNSFSNPSVCMEHCTKCVVFWLDVNLQANHMRHTKSALDRVLMYDYLSRLRRLSAAQHRTSQLLAHFQHLQSLPPLASRGLLIPTCCRICSHNCRRPSNKLRYACLTSAGSLLSCHIVALNAG